MEKPKKKSRAKNPQRKVSPENYRPRKRKQSPDEELIRVNGTPYAKENPAGANQWIKDPRQDIMWEKYLKGWMKGTPNARKAALEAGYSETTAMNITNFIWFKDKFEKLRRKEFLSKGERNLERFLDLDYSKLDEITGERTGIDIDKAKIVADMTKLVVTTLGKDEGYSSKTTLDQKVSGEVQIRAVSYADAIIEAPKQAEIIDIPSQENV
jgi:hypothetical protein